MKLQRRSRDDWNNRALAKQKTETEIKTETENGSRRAPIESVKRYAQKMAAAELQQKAVKRYA